MDENEYPERIDIYSTEPKESDHGFLEKLFIPVFDYTDHLHFVCRECKEIADVVEVFRYDKQTPTIYFKFSCPKCKAPGQRKIYLELKDLMHLEYPTQTKLLNDIEEKATEP